jgi:tetratricopeptide (TPR) repeat protein
MGLRIGPAVCALFCAGSLGAQEKAKPIELSEVPEKRPYPEKTYHSDRWSTGPFIRKLRRIRAAEGNQAAAARIPAEWEAFLKLAMSQERTRRQALDDWGFWVWHEAQHDTGKGDPEWSLMLYRSIYDIAKAEKRFDWTMHVRFNLVTSYQGLCQWANARAVLNEAEDYYKSIGFDLDPNMLPEAGDWDAKVPFVKIREFPFMVPNGRAVVRAQRREEKDPSKPIYLDNMLTGLMAGLAYEDEAMGRWDRAIERCIWIREWANAVNEHNSDKDRKFKVVRDNEDDFRSATGRMISILVNLGFTEKALALIDDGLARKRESGYGLRDRLLLEIRKERLLVEYGEEDETLIATMDRFIALEGTSPHIVEGWMSLARIYKAQGLVTLGRFDEAEALLLAMTGRDQRRLAGWLYPELALVDIMIECGEFAKAKKTLHELMEVLRVTGKKTDELALYRTYMKWAFRSGNWEEALRAQHEVMRLVESFRMTPLIPQEQAVLSRIMAELGDRAESDRLADLARAGAKGRESRFVEIIERQLRDRPDKGSASPASRVLIQPRRVVSVPLDGLPARAVISLVNHGGREAKGLLRVKGLPAKIHWDQASGQGTVEVEDAPGDSVERVSGEIRIGAGMLAIFSCFGQLAGDMQRSVLLEWEGGGGEPCEWIIGAAETEGEGAVIDAAEYVDDPFFLIPIHHHLQSKTKGMVNLRVVTSQPCRVELYDGEGALQMVDAQGNGSLADAGDWLGLDSDRNLAAEVLPDPATGEARFLLHLDPKDWNGAEPLRIRVEWLVNGEWFLAAEDRIIAGK